MPPLLAADGLIRYLLRATANGEENMEQDAFVSILRPCPFCGDRPQVVVSGTYTVQCPDCGAIGPPAPNVERAAARWNLRKGDGPGGFG